MAAEKWTVDGLHVALPHSANRQQLLQDVNLTSLDKLPETLASWAGAAENLEAARPRIEEARRLYKKHGRLPDEDSLADMTEAVADDAAPRRGAA